MSLLPVGFGASGDDYEITDSLRFRQSADANLSRTFSTPTDGKVWTYSVWVKRSKAPTVLGYGTPHLLCTTGSGAQGIFGFGWNNIDDIALAFSGYGRRYTTGLFRDPSAWYHIVLKIDTTQATEANRALLYVNGALFPWNTQSGISQNSTTQINQAVAHNIGDQTGQPYQSFDGYMTEANFIDGQALTADDFGEYDANGTWKAKEYTGTYGTNGFYLPMKPTTQAELQNTVLYSGNTNEQSIDGVGYAPDFVWIKNRTGANNHYLYDTVRGTDRSLSSQSTGAESVGGQQLTSFDTDGFTVPYDVSGYNNYAGRSYVAWTWDAGDNQTSTGISSVQYFGQGVAQSVKGFGFSPDFVWIKSRDIAASHILIDSVRGSGFELSSNSTGAETSNGVTRFESIDSDGFTIANTTASSINQQNRNYIAWGWDAGDGDPVTNTTGDINSTVKANDATGFSIVSYTGNGSNGATVGHGLSTTPSAVIVKDRNNTNNWAVYHKDLTSTNYSLVLNSTTAETNYGSSFIAPASSTLSLANGSQLNASSRAYIAYCFSEVSGVSKFDTYTGNGSSTGPTITTGFRPGFVMTKRIDSSGNWYINDGTRSPFNPTVPLYADLSNAEGGNGIDLLSNGFQIKNADSSQNASGGTYIYMAFKGSYSDHVSPLNDDGSIDSRVKANPDKGFSIVSYEGTGGATDTIGHGLSSAPEMVIVKDRDAGNFWSVYHVGVDATAPEDYLMRLNTTDARLNGSVYWNDTAPTSSVFTVGTSSALNAANRYIAYCFHSVAGYSKFGSYTGTGTTTGNVTTLGFRPAFLMIKGTTGTSEWVILDNTRDPNPDPAKNVLHPNRTNADSTAAAGLYVKFTDTGFQPVGVGTDTNASGQTFIYMAFADTRDAKFNFDASGNKNNWLPNNINSNAESETTYDLMKDTPSLVDENAANFATLNPLRQVGGATITDGNLTLSGSDDYTFGTIALPSSGKFYYEMTCGTVGNTVAVGVANSDAVILAGYLSADFRLYASNGNKYTTTGASSYGATYTTGDVIGVACDMTNNTISFYKNNVSQGNAFTDLADTTRWIPYLGSFNATGGGSINFGQRPFAYTPPTGFLKLNTFNLPDSTIEDGSDYFNTVLYTGNATTDTAITGVGFQPDFVWLKDRTNAERHILFDAVRGASKVVSSSTTAAEEDRSDFWKTLDSDGFTLGYNDPTNRSGDAFVSWNWKANGSGVTDNSGTLNATVSANTTAGFSIVTYTGNNGSNQTVGHGLGVTPSMFIIKNRTNATSWPVYHKDISTPLSNAMYLNSLNAAFGWAYWGTGGLSSTVFPVHYGSADVTNQSGKDYIAYCFAEVEGYSSFGSYTGNGSTDGTFVYTGFRPAWIMVKRSTDVGNWQMFDSSRDLYNPENGRLYANLTDAENDENSVDFVSNGFKLRATSGDNNSSGSTYIYMAFAENPFKNSNAR